ncbi:MAG TPA: type VI secretion system tube protein Hcp [Rhodopila sp.]|nr:type VI secretion system tube protein Hcp [Rhodopila sp.]
MAIYLKYDGVPGNVKTKGFENQIELNSASFGAGRNMGMSKRSDVNRGHAEPHLSEISVTKMWDDAASSLLLQDALAGVGDKKATITFTTTSKNVVLGFMTFELEGVVVSNYSLGTGGESEPSESFNMNYNKITVTPYEVKDGKATKKSVVIYALPEMQANG